MTIMTPLVDDLPAIRKQKFEFDSLGDLYDFVFRSIKLKVKILGIKKKIILLHQYIKFSVTEITVQPK